MSSDEKKSLFEKAVKEFNYCKNCSVEAWPSYSPELMQGYICKCDLTGISVDKKYCKKCKYKK